VLIAAVAALAAVAQPATIRYLRPNETYVYAASYSESKNVSGNVENNSGDGEVIAKVLSQTTKSPAGKACKILSVQGNVGYGRFKTSSQVMFTSEGGALTYHGIKSESQPISWYDPLKMPQSWAGVKEISPLDALMIGNCMFLWPLKRVRQEVVSVPSGDFECIYFESRTQNSNPNKTGIEAVDNSPLTKLTQVFQVWMTLDGIPVKINNQISAFGYSLSLSYELRERRR
jgi:hypothetical protein